MKPSVLAGFPESLIAVAFVHGEEAAWEQKDCPAVLDWLSENNNAILGTELWTVRGGSISTALSTKLGPTLYVSSSNPLKAETWNDYVRRSVKEAGDLIAAFRWPEDALEPERPVYFNIAWASRQWFHQTLGTSSLTIRFA
ncbi:MAG: hypothetical protein WA542_17015 [Candidatus Acidiferrum sp.]